VFYFCVRWGILGDERQMVLVQYSAWLRARLIGGGLLASPARESRENHHLTSPSCNEHHILDFAIPRTKRLIGPSENEVIKQVKSISK
jgi:hypothetical protein